MTDVGSGQSQQLSVFQAELIKLLHSYYSGNVGDQLLSLKIDKIVPRRFSEVSFITAQTMCGVERLVAKRIVHDPIIERIATETNQAVNEFNILNKLYELFKNIDGCSTPKPICCLPEIETYVMEYVHGDSLDRLLMGARYFSSRSKFKQLSDYYYLCGVWLRQFQTRMGITDESNDVLSETIVKCQDRLRIMDASEFQLWPSGFGEKISKRLHQLLRSLQDKRVSVSARHGDFGPWNILANDRGITVIDFFGYTIEPVAVDYLKMMMNFEDQKRGLVYSRQRINVLKGKFIEGYGKLPQTPREALLICETLHRVSSIHGCMASGKERLHRRVERYICTVANMDWLKSVLMQ